MFTLLLVDLQHNELLLLMKLLQLLSNKGVQMGLLAALCFLCLLLVWKRLCMCIYVYACVCVCVHVCVSTCVCRYVCIHVCGNVCVFVFVSTQQFEHI